MPLFYNGCQPDTKWSNTYKILARICQRHDYQRICCGRGWWTSGQPKAFNGVKYIWTCLLLNARPNIGWAWNIGETGPDVWMWMQFSMDWVAAMWALPAARMLRQLAETVFWSIHCHAAASLAAGIAHPPTIHCSCILVNSLPRTSHCNVATRLRNCILHFKHLWLVTPQLQTEDQLLNLHPHPAPQTSPSGAPLTIPGKDGARFSASRDSHHPVPLTVVATFWRVDRC